MKYLSILTLFTFLVACKTESPKEEKTIIQEEQKPLVEASEFDALMQKIDDDLPNLVRIESLIYHKENGASVSATAYLDQNEIITKIEEEQIDGQTGTISKLSFYSNGGVLFASKWSGEKIKDKKAYFSQEITFYAPDGKVKMSKERTSDFEEYIDNEEYRQINAIKHDSTNAMEALKQQGPFVTTFQGFVDSGPYHFLIVGEDVPNDGYTASLSIQEDSPTLRYLKKKGRMHLERS